MNGDSREFAYPHTSRKGLQPAATSLVANFGPRVDGGACAPFEPREGGGGGGEAKVMIAKAVDPLKAELCDMTTRLSAIEEAKDQGKGQEKKRQGQSQGVDTYARREHIVPT